MLVLSAGHFLLAATSSSSGGSTTSALAILLLLAVAFYFVLYRPQRRRMRQHQDLVTTLSPGDEIVTIGGIKGYIKLIEGDDLEIEIADGVIIRVVKQAIARKIDDAPVAAGTSEEQSDVGLEEPGDPDDS